LNSWVARRRHQGCDRPGPLLLREGVIAEWSGSDRVKLITTMLAGRDVVVEVSAADIVEVN
jgi:hypothetical protein